MKTKDWYEVGRHPEFRDRGMFGVVGSDEKVEVVRWIRPYGIPTAQTADGREFHQQQLIVIG